MLLIFPKKLIQSYLARQVKILMVDYAFCIHYLQQWICQQSAHSFATGPVIADPFISPLLFTMTPALSSKQIKVPHFLLNDSRVDFFMEFRFLFSTLASTRSPDAAEGNLFKGPLIPFTEMMYKFLVSVLSVQLTTAPTGRPRF